MTKSDYFQVLGRRKHATARVRMTGGKGNILINSKPAPAYFTDSKYLLRKLQEPFTRLDIENTYDISAVVSGGGQDGQAEAIRLGIAKALCLINEDFKATLKRADLLTRDPRDKERKKFGLKGARKRQQFTKR